MSSLKSLGEIINNFNDFNNKVYIPLYQRNYKWCPEMAGKLASDLLDQFIKEEKKDYNLGVLTVYMPIEKEIHILDGQQRMITLCLIVKALGKINHNNWFKLLFERDMDFEDTIEANSRFKFIYNVSDSNADSYNVDICRMKNNLKKITEKITNVEDADRFYEYILKHVKLLYRETKSEPIDEFLNMNFNKTPFCSADHIKAYMVLDADANNQEITISKIQELWRRLERVLFQIESCTGMENEMFSLIKKNYNEEVLNMNRIEILFYDRYLKNQNHGQNATKIASNYHDKVNSLEEEYIRLSYYYDVMKSVLDEIAIVDKNGNRHPNYNALNAYNLLCKKNDKARFFEIIGDEENIKKKTDVVEALEKYFNLTGTSHKGINQIGNPNSKNQFMEAMLSSQNDFKTEYSVAEKNYVKKNDKKFEEYYDAFNDSFAEYIELIEVGKKANSSISGSLEEGKKTLGELLENANIEKIKIPSIQRDYVMGSSDDYLISYLQHISFRYWWSCYPLFKKDMKNNNNDYTEENYIELENILFKNNDNKKILELNKITPNASGRQARYNKYKSSLIAPPEVTDFRRYGEGSKYAEFCYRLNSINKLNDSFNKGDFSSLDNNYIKKFNAGCIMGYLDADKTFWVYDGQQRLVTSVVLLAYLTSDENNKDVHRKLKKLSFNGRNGANKCLEFLLDYDVNKDELKKNDTIDKMQKYIDDKSSYSIYKLIENYNILKDNFTIKIAIDYLLNGMEFEFAMVDKIDDVEQLFIEMNEGVKLTPDEQYKAEFNYIISKNLDVDNAKALLRKIDNEWLNFYKTEEEEVKWIKYFVKMACFEINGYDSSFKDGSLQGLNKAVIELVETLIDMVVKAKYESPIEEEIGLWVRLLVLFEFEKDKAEYMSSDNKIYFEKNFYNFILLYQKFASKENKIDETARNTKCFEIIKEFRINKCLVLPTELTEKKDNSTDAEEENPAEKIYRQMLENRKDQFEFRGISSWECNSSSYDTVEMNKDKSYFLSQVQPQIGALDLTITENMNIGNFIENLSQDQIIHLCKNVIIKERNIIGISETLAKGIVLNNQECCGLIFDPKNKKIDLGGNSYYFYANCRWREEDKKLINNNTKTDLSQEIMNKFNTNNPTFMTSIIVTSEILKSCTKSETIYDVLTGLWYTTQNKEIIKDLSDDCKCKLMKISATNFKVFSKDYSAEDSDLLYQYKYCHENAKMVFEAYIAQYYFEEAINDNNKEKLYYIAKCYLKGNDSLRNELFDRYISLPNANERIKQNIRPLFLDKDFGEKHTSECDDYCKQRGYPATNTNSN